MWFIFVSAFIWNFLSFSIKHIFVGKRYKNYIIFLFLFHKKIFDVILFHRNISTAQNTHKGNGNNAFNDLNKISANTTTISPPPTSLSGPSAVTSIVGSPARRCEVSPIQNHVRVF